MRRHAWRYASKKMVLAGHDWTWWCERCSRTVTVFKSHGSTGRYARPSVDDPGHDGVSGNCDDEVVRAVIES